jgi:Xaa-Pro aminopeptidase
MHYQDKINNLKELIQKEKLDALLISSIPNIIYLTGFSNFTALEREVYLIITLKSQYIITDGRYAEAVGNSVKHFELKEQTSAYTFKGIAKDIFKKDKVKSLGIEEEDISVREFKELKKVLKNLKDFKVDKIRISKSLDEIEHIKKSCAIGDRAFDFILTQLSVGVTEKDTANLMEDFIKTFGADKSFDFIVGFGSSSSVPHHQTGTKKLTGKNGDFVLLDFGVRSGNYCSDMTRTVFFGKADAEKKKIYEMVKVAQQKAVEFIEAELKKGKKKVKASEADKAARDYITSEGYPTIPHSLGHGIGLQVHEAPSLSPRSKYNLAEGMVFSIEPGIYIPGYGGVRIEDLFAIENGRLVQLTQASKELIEL